MEFSRSRLIEAPEGMLAGKWAHIRSCWQMTLFPADYLAGPETKQKDQNGSYDSRLVEILAELVLALSWGHDRDGLIGVVCLHRGFLRADPSAENYVEFGGGVPTICSHLLDAFMGRDDARNLRLRQLFTNGLASVRTSPIAGFPYFH
jgi:hypothetical protein